MGSDLAPQDRKSTCLNSSHSQISYAVFCLKKIHDLEAARRNVAMLRDGPPCHRAPARPPPALDLSRPHRGRFLSAIGAWSFFFFLMFGPPPVIPLLPRPPASRP